MKIKKKGHSFHVAFHDKYTFYLSHQKMEYKAMEAKEFFQNL